MSTSAQIASTRAYHDSRERHGEGGGSNDRWQQRLGFLLGAGAGISLALVVNKKELHASAPPLKVRKKDDVSGHKAGTRLPNLKEFSMKEVNKHDNMKDRIWVTFQNGVYDITDFIPKHPGAKNILMASGGSVEPFWEHYAVHKDNIQVFDLLEEYRVGNLREEDVKANAAIEPHDPFANEPERNPNLLVLSQKPFNAETPLPILAKEFITPNDLFYVRSHLPTPDVEPSDYELEIQGAADEVLVIDLKRLKSFPKYEITAAIQCGGNRRSEMNAVKPLKGLGWKGGAIGNATWGGARLYDVLKAAGYDENKHSKIRHLIFEGYDIGADGTPYGASIPVEKGLDPRGDVLLAYEMNGETLPRDHGYPIRVVVPGVVGARNVKWLNRIILSEKESDSHFQQGDYKGFNPSTNWDNVDFSKSPAIQNMPVTSSICEPEPNTNVKPGQKVKLRGYAWSGGGNKIVRLDLTADKGKSWISARLLEQADVPEPRHFGWTLWEADMKVPEDATEFEVWSKAVDSNYSVQPESFENIWNLRGLLSNAYCRLKFKVEGNN